MKSSELRIGNHLHLKIRNVDVIVEEILKDDFIVCDATTNEWKISDYIPIKLTEEFFRENNFLYSSYIATGDYHVKATKMISIGDYFYNLNVIGVERDLWKLEIESNPKLDIKYRRIVSGSLVNFSHIHTLQNLVYELTKQ